MSKKDRDKYTREERIAYLNREQAQMSIEDQNIAIGGIKIREKHDRKLAFYIGIILGLGLKIIDVIVDLAIKYIHCK